MLNKIARSRFFECRNGEKAPLPFSAEEYERRLASLRTIMADKDLPAVLLTSMHNIAYYSGFLYCSFGRPYGCVVTPERCVTVSANIDGGQPWRRSFSENLIYTDWERGNFWRAVAQIVPQAGQIGIEGDHLSIGRLTELRESLGEPEIVDIAGDAMATRMIKSAEEIALIREGARVADIGGEAIRDAIRVGVSEVEVASVGRAAMENEIARAFPDSEVRDTWVWFQSGLNTDGAHNPLTTRRLEAGDILSLNTFR